MTKTLPLATAIRYGKTMAVECWAESRIAALLDDLAANGYDGRTIDRIARAYHEQVARGWEHPVRHGRRL